jgi:hypothetical protein
MNTKFLVNLTYTRDFWQYRFYLALSAQKAVEFGADIIDINMGCPAKKVCNKAAGSALMQDEILVKDILALHSILKGLSLVPAIGANNT